MIASQQANHPRWTGEGFEIWFFVVLVPGLDRALWVRLTRFADPCGADARVWAVLSERGQIHAEREIHPLAALETDGDDLQVRIAGSELRHGSSYGRCGTIAWEFEYDATDPLIERLPKLPRFLPLGTHSTHPHAEAKVHGWIELDGQRLSLDGGMLTQMHIWGTQRVESLRWVWAPRFEGHGEDTELELTAVAPYARGPSVCALWARLGPVLFDHSGLTKSALASAASPRPGVLHHITTEAGQRLVMRAWARPQTFAGWDYRKVGGGELRVAQSNLAQVELELYRRVGLGWRPERRLRSTCAALEVHGLEDHAEFGYVAWDSPTATIRERRPVPAKYGPTSASGPGEWIDTPAPTRIVALGLTYKAHAAETSNTPESVVFEIDRESWSVADAPLIRPSDAQLSAAIASLDPTLPPLLSDWGFIPAMLDYEVELGLVLLDGLDDPDAPGRVALVIANDVTARILQVLGEGCDNRLDYWRAAKSFPGFTPTTPRAWIPEHFALDRWPALTLETHVDGQLRQRSEVGLMMETPRQMLARVRASVGPLGPGTLLLTGTPGGIALTVPRWKRLAGEWLLDRVGRARASLASFSGGLAFLRPGDLVDVSGGFLGGIERVIESE